MENNRNVKINKYINYNKYFEGYRFIEGYNNYLINEKGNIIEIKPVKIDEHLRVYLNNKYVSLINIFAKRLHFVFFNSIHDLSESILFISETSASRLCSKFISPVSSVTESSAGFNGAISR